MSRKYASVSFQSLLKASEEQQAPSSGQSLPPPVQTVGFLCTEMPTDVVGSAQIAAVSPAPGHISNDLKAWPFGAISHTATLPLEQGFYSPAEIWIIVSTFGFNLLKEGGFVKEVQCKQPPVYITHYKRQKGLRNGLNLQPLNYRLARPGILSEGSARQDRKKEGLIAGTGGCCGTDPHPLTPTLSPDHLVAFSTILRLLYVRPLPFTVFVLMWPSHRPGVIPIIFHSSVQLFTFYWWQWISLSEFTSGTGGKHLFKKTKSPLRLPGSCCRNWPQCGSNN